MIQFATFINLLMPCLPIHQRKSLEGSRLTRMPTLLLEPWIFFERSNLEPPPRHNDRRDIKRISSRRDTPLRTLKGGELSHLHSQPPSSSASPQL